MLALEPGGVLGQTWAGLVREADSDDHTLALALRRGREGSGTFHRVTRGDGTLTTLDYVVLPLSEDDRVLGAALVFTEVGPG